MNYNRGEYGASLCQSSFVDRLSDFQRFPIRLLKRNTVLLSLGQPARHLKLKHIFSANKVLLC